VKTNVRILKKRFCVWPFLAIALLFRFLFDEAISRRNDGADSRSLIELRSSLRDEPDAFIWHDLLSDQYFTAGNLKRSLFHRREAIRIWDQEQAVAMLEGGSS
jgi:hypothetical protein